MTGVSFIFVWRGWVTPPPPPHLTSCALPPPDYLHVGDYITLKTAKFDGYMFADGILQETFSVDESNHILAFEEALYCIHYPRQYSAARELDEFNEAHLQGRHNGLDDETLKKYLTALRVSQGLLTFSLFLSLVILERKR